MFLILSRTILSAYITSRQGIVLVVYNLTVLRFIQMLLLKSLGTFIDRLGKC